MNAQLKMLLWKEWRERRWQLWLCLAWVGVAAFGSVLWAIPLWNACLQLAFLYSLMMPIFIAMRTALGETTDGGQTFSAGLPIAMRRQALIRLAGGWAVLVAPLLVGGALVALATFWSQWPGRAGTGHQWPGVWDNLGVLPGSVAALVWPTTALYLFLCLLGTAVRSESRFGVIAVVAAVVWTLNFWSGLPPFYLDRISPALSLFASAITPNTLNILTRLLALQKSPQGSPASVIVIPLVVNAILMCLAAWLFVRRYGHPRPAAIHHRWPRLGLCLPFRFPLSRTPDTALALLTLRQTVPLCLPGLAVICLVTILALLSAGDRAGHAPLEFADMFQPVAGYVTILWAMIVGAGTFSEEIDARLGESWRSWPISVGRFFTIKYLVGLLAVLVVLEAPAIVADWNSALEGKGEKIDWSYVVCLMPLHAMVYSLAVAASCILRRSTLGAMLTFAIYLPITIGLDSFHATARFEPLYVYSMLTGRNSDGPSTSYPLVALAMALSTIVVSAAAAYFALARYETPRRWRPARAVLVPD